MKWAQQLGLMAALVMAVMGCLEDTDVTETGYLEGDFNEKFVSWAALAGESAADFEDECIEEMDDWYDQARKHGCLGTATAGEATIVQRGTASTTYEDATFSFFYGGRAPDRCAWIGADILWNNGNDDLLVGLAGADTGHFIDLGDDVYFDDITWDEVLNGELGLTDADLDALLYHFGERTPQLIHDQIAIALNHSYLLRIWHGEYELFVKLQITSFEPASQATFRWELLHRRTTAELCDRYAESYGYWLLNEKGDEEGNITLYDRATYGDYVKATFNAEFATRDMVYLTLNEWDVIFENGLRGFDWHEDETITPRGTIADMGVLDLAEVSRDDAATLEFLYELEPVLGHTYYVRSHVYGRDSEVALTVTEYEEGDHVSFDWRELYLADSGN